MIKNKNNVKISYVTQMEVKILIDVHQDSKCKVTEKVI